MGYVRAVTTREEIEDLLRRSTAAQGMPLLVEDRFQAAKLAVMIKSARERQKGLSLPTRVRPPAARLMIIYHPDCLHKAVRSE